MAQFDFGPGFVRALKLLNGGGWVADTATLMDTATATATATAYIGLKRDSSEKDTNSF